MLALEHAFNSKEKFLTRYNLADLKDGWVGPLLPQAVLADRGELLSNQVEGMIQDLGVAVSNTPPYRPDWKGIVERRFKLIDDEVIIWLPGAIRELPKNRRKKGNANDAKLDIHEFRKILTYMFSYYNLSHELEKYPLSSDMLEQQVKPIPMQLWQWGILHRSGKLHYQSRDMVRASLLPRAEASVTRDGIMFQTLAYTSPRERREKWTSRARIDGTWRVNVVYDKRTTDWILLRQNGTFEVAKLRRSHEGYGRRDWYEVEDYRAVKQIDKDESLPEQRATKRSMQNSIDAIVRQAEGLTEGDKSYPKDGSLKQAREEMRDHLRTEESWQPQEASDESVELEPVDTKKTLEHELDSLLNDPAASEQTRQTLEERDLGIIDKLRRQASDEDE